MTPYSGGGQPRIGDIVRGEKANGVESTVVDLHVGSNAYMRDSIDRRDRRGIVHRGSDPAKYRLVRRASESAGAK